MISFYYKNNDYKALEIVVGKFLIYTSYLTPIALFDSELNRLTIIDEKITITTSRHRNAIYSRYCWLDEENIDKLTKEQFHILYNQLFDNLHF